MLKVNVFSRRNRIVGYLDDEGFWVLPKYINTDSLVLAKLLFKSDHAIWEWPDDAINNYRHKFRVGYIRVSNRCYREGFLPNDGLINFHRGPILAA